MDDNYAAQNEDTTASQGHISGSRVTSPLPETRSEWINDAPAGPAKKRKSNGLPGLLLAAMLVFGMLFGGAGAGVALLVAGYSPNAAPAATTPAAATTNNAQAVELLQANTITNVYKKISPSVVMVDSTIAGTGRFNSGGEATGTGIVVDTKSGYILTNNHVINGATSVKIELPDGSQYAAKVVGTAPQDDLAVLQADIPAGKVVAAELGDSSTVQAGDPVIAVGYPFGLEQSVTSGIVSGLDRESQGESGRTLSGLIQTDAAINPGNSGGPLLNDQGQVVGINTMIESPVQAFTGIGLAIPINRAKSLLPQLEQGSSVERPWLGISGAEITASLQQQFNLPVSAGVLVMDVTAGGPAAAAGLKASVVGTDASGNQTDITTVGDIITAVDGQKIGSVVDITNYLDGKHPGDKVALTVIRDGKEISVDLTLQAWPSSLNNNN